MFIPEVIQQLEHLKISGDWADYLESVFGFAFIAFLIVGPLVAWIIEICNKLIYKKIDSRLMLILKNEFPNYDYRKLKSEILSLGLSNLYKCPLCGNILSRDLSTDEPMKCSNKYCSYS